MMPTHPHDSFLLAHSDKWLLMSRFEDSKDTRSLLAFRKRAFSVSGQFRKMLTDLIRSMHNSNHKLHQITLSGEIIEEEKFHVIGFVPADVVNLREEIWFKKLDIEQIDSVTEFISNY